MKTPLLSSCMLLGWLSTSVFAFCSSSGTLRSNCPLSLFKRGSNTQEDETQALQRDIEAMRVEALGRLEELAQELESFSATAKAPVEKSKNPSNQNRDDDSDSKPNENVVTIASAFDWANSEADQMEELYHKRRESDRLAFLKEQEEQRLVTSGSSVKNSKPQIHLLDETRWRLTLNIGREPGTWMPKTWGVSGDRLRLNLEMEFTPEQLYEREEFLNGVSGAKVLKVCNDQATLAPTMTEGGRNVRVTQGGWRVAPSEGPMGTSVLRFYVQLEEETRHKGSDIYCPPGRIYCTCGYFPMQDHRQKVSQKDALRKEIHELEATYQSLESQNDQDQNIFSWGRLERGKKMMDLRMQANKIREKYHEAQVREPEKALLRLSQDQSVGLTREGGVCCKVHKGLAIEYHILGRFEVASMANRDHHDYRELLP